MREMKFRAWDKRKKEWTTDRIIIEIETGLPWWTEFGEMMDEAEDIILVEYTGLKDKNGKEIYEGDILGAKDRWFKIRVKFTRGMFIVGNLGPIQSLYEYLNEQEEDFIIIGNKFENPELIK